MKIGKVIVANTIKATRKIIIMNEDKLDVCRICLGYKHNENRNEFYSLFEKYNDFLVVEQLNSICKVNIIEGDGLPDKICIECLISLEHVVNFVQKCVNSKNMLQKVELLDEVDNEPIIKKEDTEYDYIKHIPDGRKAIKYENINTRIDDSYNNDTDFGEPKYQPSITQKNTSYKRIVGAEENEKSVKKSRAIDLKLECHDCGGVFRTKCKLRVHWKKAHKPKLICMNCKRTFKSYKAYHIHLKVKTKSCLAANKFRIEGEGKSRTFFCKYCEYKTNKARDLRGHSVVHTGERPFKCNTCFKGFSQVGSLHSHYEIVHKVYRFQSTCQYCGIYIKGRNKFYRHITGHMDRKVQCDICKKFLKDKKVLTLHLKRHSGIRAYTCDRCASAFFTCSELLNHIRNTHNKSKQYKCDLCKYITYRNEALKRHKAKHTNTNVVCIICGKFQESEQALIVHQKKHTNRSYSCLYCDNMYNRKDSLNRHMRSKHKSVNVDITTKATEKLEYVIKLSPQ